MASILSLKNISTGYPQIPSTSLNQYAFENYEPNSVTRLRVNFQDTAGLILADANYNLSNNVLDLSQFSNVVFNFLKEGTYLRFADTLRSHLETGNKVVLLWTVSNDVRWQTLNSIEQSDWEELISASSKMAFEQKKQVIDLIRHALKDHLEPDILDAIVRRANYLCRLEEEYRYWFRLLEALKIKRE